MDHHHHQQQQQQQQKPSAASAAHVQSPTQSLHSMHSHPHSHSQSHPHTPSHSPPRVKHLSYPPGSASASDTPSKTRAGSMSMSGTGVSTGGGVSSPRSPSSPGGPPGDMYANAAGTEGDGQGQGHDNGQGVVEEEDLNIFVSDLLEQMTCKFENIGSSIMGRIDDMGDRIDQLEHSIGDLLVSQGLGEDSGTISAITHTNTTITSSNAAAVGAGVMTSGGAGEGVGVGNTPLKHTDGLGLGLSRGDKTK